MSTSRSLQEQEVALKIFASSLVKFMENLPREVEEVAEEEKSTLCGMTTIKMRWAAKNVVTGDDDDWTMIGMTKKMTVMLFTFVINLRQLDKTAINIAVFLYLNHEQSFIVKAKIYLLGINANGRKSWHQKQKLERFQGSSCSVRQCY